MTDWSALYGKAPFLSTKNGYCCLESPYPSGIHKTKQFFRALYKKQHSSQVKCVYSIRYYFVAACFSVRYLSLINLHGFRLPGIHSGILFKCTASPPNFQIEFAYLHAPTPTPYLLQLN